MNKRSFIIAWIACFMIIFITAAGHIQTVSAHKFADASPTMGYGWATSWGGATDDNADNVVIDKWGNIYVAGGFSGTVDFDPGSGVADYVSNGGTDAFLSKFSSNGTFQWARTWGGSGRDVAGGIGVDSFGNVYVDGPFQNSVDFNPDPLVTDMHSSNNKNGANNMFLSKFSPDGTFQWARTWGPSDAGGEAYGLAVDSADDIYAQGDFSGSTTDFDPWDPQHPDIHTNHPPVPSTGPVLFDAFLSKFDSNGDYMWAKTWGGEGYDDGDSVTVDGSGNVYVAGMYASQTINFDPAGGISGTGHPANDSGIVVDVFLSKFDTGGNFQWVRTWGGQGTDDAAGTIAVDGANNVYVGGRFASVNCDFDPGSGVDLHSTNGSFDAWISKFDPSGTFLWAKTWGGSGWDATVGLAVDSSNNVYTTGNFVSQVDFNPGGTAALVNSQGGNDVFFNEFAPDGTFQWVKTWGGAGDDYGYHLALDGLGDIAVVGSFQGSVTVGTDNLVSNGGSDAYLIKLMGNNYFNFLPLVIH